MNIGQIMTEKIRRSVIKASPNDSKNTHINKNIGGTTMKVYFAAPIFTEAHQMYNEYIAQKIEAKFPGIDIYLPQRNKSINDKTKCATAEDICVGDFDNNLNNTDIVIAIVDGDVPPIGTTLEIGYFSRMCQEEKDNYNKAWKKAKTVDERMSLTAPHRKIISLYTDTRECSNTINDAKVEKLNEFAECQFSYINLLLVGALKRYGTMCRSVDELLIALEDALNNE